MTHLLFVLALAVQQPTSPGAPPDDPFVWLEDVKSARAMGWVNAKNAATIAVLGQGPLYQTLYDRLKRILESKATISYLSVLSRGASDASELRECNISTRHSVPSGFKAPEAKSSIAWLDDSTLPVRTDS